MNSNPQTITTNITTLIWFDKSYVKSNAGLLKIVIVIVNLAAFIVNQIVKPSYVEGTHGFFSFATMTGFWISLALFGFYAFHIVEKYYFVKWIFFEFVYSIIWCLFLFVSSILLAFSSGVLIVAAIFGFISCAIYGYEAKIAYTRYSAGEIAQGERTVSPN